MEWFRNFKLQGLNVGSEQFRKRTERHNLFLNNFKYNSYLSVNFMKLNGSDELKKTRVDFSKTVNELTINLNGRPISLLFKILLNCEA
jgi:hypothetical protein